METDDDVTVPADAAAVGRRYRRAALAASGCVAFAVVAILLGVFVWTDSLVAMIAVGLVLVVAARAPVFRTEGRTVLTTDADVETVLADFRSATPPSLAFQWGGADAVRATDDGGEYDLSAAFGLATAQMETTVRAPQPAEADDVDLELVVTADDRRWGTYRVAVDERDGQTVVTVDVESDRKFGLRRLPQHLVATRYREAALAAQGYAVESFDSSIRFR